MTALFSIVQLIRSLFGGGGVAPMIIQAILASQKQEQQAKNDAARLRSQENIAFWTKQLTLHQEANAEGTERQGRKMNHAVFWALLCIALLPGLGTYLLIAVYNVLWWSEGVWPQPWKIAAFPPPYDLWSQMAIEWLFDPVELAKTVGVAAAAGYITGVRK